MFINSIKHFIGVLTAVLLRVKESLNENAKNKPCGGFIYQYIFNPFIVVTFFAGLASILVMILVFVFVVPIAGLARGSQGVGCWYCSGGVDIFVVARWLWLDLNVLYFYLGAFLLWPFGIGVLDYVCEDLQKE